jgi:CAAX prenyl protease-like protein
MDDPAEAAPETPNPEEEIQTAPASNLPAPPPPFDYDGPGGRRMWLVRNEQWLIYCLPFIIYMVVGMFEPTAPTKGVFEVPHGLTSFITYNLYPYIYSLKIFLTCLTIVLIWPGYWQFPWKVSGLSVVVGIVGAVLWVVISKGQQLIDTEFLKDKYLRSLTKLGARSGFNPLRELRDNPALAYSFLAIRFFGLVIVVPIIEEFFLRGFLMRYVIHIDWWTVPFATMTPLAIAVGIGVPMLMHPQELIAAFVWFSMITWLMFHTKSIWDCIVAHSVTNLLMGIWVLYSGDWWLM